MAEAHGDEETPLLHHPKSNRKSTAASFLSRWRTHLMADVSRDRADLVILFCYLITGLLDSASISVWGSFVSMQTGNTVYFGLGLASPADSTRWIKSGVSLVSFCLGSLVFSRFHRVYSPTRRWVLCVSFIIQNILTATAACLVTITGPPAGKDEIGWQVLVPIALVAFQSCGQAVMSRALKYNALTSVVLTSIYCDLFSDAELFVLRNVERDRRTAAPLLLLMGAFVGCRFAHSSLGVAGALWTASVLKAVVVFMWLVWPAGRDLEER
ncbi:hypothetical protein N657DRAFT_655388 [Parathielavia appendiculata]|uniref:DUF1275 domain protein n=1 Tax=Parathielavia appendiculata TaxID=2587402 RepID=A0AAN6Z5W8_9PEZI|nr:hypothetical protein N657DRAFT_655388 [Parathielavia appendiculata]